MKVKELIEFLQTLNPEAEVWMDYLPFDADIETKVLDDGTLNIIPPNY